MKRFFNIVNNKLNDETENIKNIEIENIHNIINKVIETFKDKINIDSKKSTEN